MDPSLDLWIFAHRYDLPCLQQRCLKSINVQTKFLERVVEMKNLQCFLDDRVSYIGVEEMLNTVWENSLIDVTEEFEKVSIAREKLQRLVDRIEVS